MGQAAAQNDDKFLGARSKRSTNVKRDCTRAEYIIKHIKKMMPLRSALLRLIAFTGASATWWAHNGKSFDFPILRGNAERVDVELDDITMKDSLPVVRKAWPRQVARAHQSVREPHLHQAVQGSPGGRRCDCPLQGAREGASSAEPHQARDGRQEASTARGWERAASGVDSGLGRVGCHGPRKGVHTLEELRACAKKDDGWWKSTIPLWRKVRSYVS